MKDYNKNEFWEALKSGQFLHFVKESSYGKTLSNSREVYNTVKPLFDDITGIETMYGIFFNTGNKIIAIEKMFIGTLTSCSVYPREIIKTTLKYQAAALVLAHNHPSGNCVPSPEDILITSKVMKSLLCIDTKLHDHMIIGDDYLSMADKGIILALEEKNKSKEMNALEATSFLGIKK